MKTKGDFGLIVLCAVRYAIGRRTYMPSTVIQFCKLNWADFADKDRALIRRDVGEAIARAEETPDLLGDECDAKAWKEFYKWMSE